MNSSHKHRVYSVREGTEEDEDAHFEMNIGYFDNHPKETFESMRSRWKGPNAWPRRWFREALVNHSILFATTKKLQEGEEEEEENEEEMAGYIDWMMCKKDCKAGCGGRGVFCVGLHVARPHRNRGVGTMLLREMLKRVSSASEGGEEDVLFSCISFEGHNQGAKRLYLREGYAYPSEEERRRLERANDPRAYHYLKKPLS